MKNIAVFASGRGSNFIKIYESIQQGEIPGRVLFLISDNSKAGALKFAGLNRIPSYVIPPQKFDSPQNFGKELLKLLNRQKIEWIILAGYLKQIPDNVVKEFSNRIVNIHPALLPAFGGKGMYGHHVHEAVFRSGTKISGVTVHLVNEVYDSGPVVLQKAVDIEYCGNPEEIAKKILKVEHRIYSAAIKKLLTKDFKIVSNKVLFSE